MPLDARVVEGRATSDLFDELSLALCDVSDGARIRWSGVRTNCTARDASSRRF